MKVMNINDEKIILKQNFLVINYYYEFVNVGLNSYSVM